MIEVSSVKDVPDLVVLINSAYRGESSRQGWTTEADFLEGDLRTDIPTLTGIINTPGSVVLKHVTDGQITGSVYLDIQDRGLYLGMLTVNPKLQGAGTGKKLMLAAEAFAKGHKLNCIFMNVISIRSELIAWYEKLGYYKTGEKKDFPADTKFGRPVIPLEFAIMQKDIS